MRISYLILGLLIIILLLFIGYGITTAPIKAVLVLTLGFIFSLLTIINLEVGLFLFIFVIPFTQQIKIAQIGYMPVDVGTDDIFIIFILLSWLANIARRKEPVFLKTPLNWPIFAFFTVAVLSFIGANERFGEGAVLMGFLHLFKFFEYVVIYFIVISTINDFNQIKKYLVMFFIFTGFIALVQFVAMIREGYFHVLLPPSAGYINLFIRTMGAFGSNAILAAFYCFFLSLLLGFILNTPRAEGRTALVFFAAILSFALFNTYSRSAYVGLFTAFLFLAILKEKRLFLILLAAIAFSPVYIQRAIFQRIAMTLQSLNPITFDPSAAVRIEIWGRALAAFSNYPIFGTGYWTARFVLNAEAHSQYVAILLETGIVGISIFLWLVVRMYKNAIDLMKKADTNFLRALGLGYIAAFAGILTTCFFSETLEAFRMTGPLWFITGLVSSANRLLSEKSGTSGAG